MRVKALFVVTTVFSSSMMPLAASAQTALYRALVSGPVVKSAFAIKGARAVSGGSYLVAPASDVPQPGYVHTNYKISIPDQSPQVVPNAVTRPQVGPPFSGYLAETPASLACIYQFVAPTSGCNPNSVTANAIGGSRAVALVEAYDNPSIVQDLQTYSTQFGLPTPNIQVVYATGTKPAGNTDNALETALDVDMVHAAAPSAQIIVVEAATSSYTDMGVAIDKAVQLVQQAGGGEISISYGGSEFSSVSSYDTTHFANKANVVFFASTGDKPGVEYFSSSPNVVAVGGTGTSRATLNANNYGQFKEEVAWELGGGGFSAYFTAPSYQSVIAARNGNINRRSVPDVAAVADTATPVWVACGTGCGGSSGDYYFVGGTSVAAPLVAGFVNNAGQFRPTSAAQLAFMYSQIGGNSFFDVVRGACGVEAGYTVTAATPGNPANAYDFCTGIGSPRGASGL